MNEKINKSLINPLMERIIKLLIDRDELKDFSFKKSSRKFFHDNGLVNRSFTLDYSIVISKNEKHLGVEINPIFEFRIHEIHQWLEKYYKGSNIKDYKQGATIYIFAEEAINENDLNEFKNNVTYLTLIDDEIIQKKNNYLISLLKNIGLPFFNEYETLDKIYNNITKKMFGK